MSTTLDIKIQGRDYRVACPPEEVDSLQAAATLLDARMGQLARTTKSMGERLAVMAALNLANEYNQATRAASGSATHLAPSSASLPSAPSANLIDPEIFLGRIKAIETRLDEVLTSTAIPDRAVPNTISSVLPAVSAPLGD